MKKWLILLLVLQVLQGYSQEYQLYLKFDKPVKNIRYKQTHLDSLSAKLEIEKVISALQFQGYLLAAADDISLNQKQLNGNIITGQQYLLARISKGNIGQDILDKSGFREKVFNNTPFNPQQLAQLFKSLLGTYENSGFPFAAVSLDSIRIENNIISASLTSLPNKFIVMDTLAIAGEVKVSNTYLQSYLALKKGSPYNESVIKEIDKKLKELQFLSTAKATEVSFAGDKAQATIFLNKKMANQFDGILGLQPNQADGKIEIVGDFKLQLQNVFKRAEKFALNYKGLPLQSRELNISFAIPNVFSTALSVGGAFDFFKQDTTFQNINRKVQVEYVFSGNNNLRFFLDSRSGNLISTSQYQALTSFPPFSDVNTIQYGLGFTMEKLDYKFNPTKGFSVSADASAGKRMVKKNSSLDEKLYLGIDLNTSQFRVNINFAKYFSLAKNSVALLSNQSGFIFGSSLFANELYRLGGFKSIRGFDEQSIFANRFAIFNAEYRFLLEQNSFLFAFINQALLSKFSSNSFHQENLLGFGSGINVETKAGIISLSYAVGKQGNNQLNLQRGKIHLGIISLF